VADDVESCDDVVDNINMATYLWMGPIQGGPLRWAKFSNKHNPYKKLVYQFSYPYSNPAQKSQQTKNKTHFQEMASIV
jgi:hypothetical protein